MCSVIRWMVPSLPAASRTLEDDQHLAPVRQGLLLEFHQGQLQPGQGLVIGFVGLGGFAHG